MNPERFKALFPRASDDTVRINTHEDNDHTQLQNAEPERDQATALGKAVKGKKESVRRVKVSFISYRCRLTDTDNLDSGRKDLLDGLRHAGLISGDSPKEVDLRPTEQVKVYHRYDERTQIILDYA